MKTVYKQYKTHKRKQQLHCVDTYVAQIQTEQTANKTQVHKDEQVKIKCYCGKNVIFVHYAFTLGDISTSVLYLLEIQVYMSKFYQMIPNLYFPQTYVWYTEVILSELAINSFLLTALRIFLGI